jgi:hypothetical protein
MQEIQTSKEARVFNLCQDLEEVKTQKKASSKAFNEEIKRLQAEIKELLDKDE